MNGRPSRRIDRTSGVVLAVNPGSSSLKAAVRDPDLAWDATIDDLDRGAGMSEALGRLSDQLRESGIQPDGVVHRVVHGGADHMSTTVVDDALIADLQRAIPLAPLHLPSDIASVTASRRIWPDAIHVACFDTSFHANLPELSRRLPVAEELARLGVRRYGFHGLSIQSVLRAGPEIDQAVIAHLGSGCSVTAVAGGRSRHTTMSLTPTGGMISATRSGDLDPEIVLYLIQQCGYDVDALREMLDRRSGLAGLSGGRTDLRILLSAAESGDIDARLAVDMFVRSASSAIATCALALDRFETLVFTGGVGEHSGVIRDRVRDELARLGARDLDIMVVPADEQAVMDDEARSLLDV